MVKNAGSWKHLDIGEKRRKEGILLILESAVCYLFANNQRSQAGPKPKCHPGHGVLADAWTPAPRRGVWDHREKK